MSLQMSDIGSLPDVVKVAFIAWVEHRETLSLTGTGRHPDLTHAAWKRMMRALSVLFVAQRNNGDICMVFRSATAAEDAFNSVWDYTLSGDVELCAAITRSPEYWKTSEKPSAPLPASRRTWLDPEVDPTSSTFNSDKAKEMMDEHEAALRV